MAKGKEKPAKGKQRAATSERRKKGRKTAEEKPPESAENFEHVLRRLISARDRSARRRL